MLFEEILDEKAEPCEFDERLEPILEEDNTELRLAAEETITITEDACEDFDDKAALDSLDIGGKLDRKDETLDRVIGELAVDEIDRLLELVTVIDDWLCPSSPPPAPQAPKLNRLIINNELTA